jgi:hypothetical protein
MAWARFKKIGSTFYPFLYFIWLGCLNEISSIIVTHMGYYSIVNFNLGILFESCFLLLLFKKWHLFDRHEKIYRGFFLFYIIAWLSEMIFIAKISLTYGSYYRILFSFITVLMSITIINFLLMKERKTLWKNSMFIICCAYVIYYSIAVLSEAFFAYGFKISNSLATYINYIMVLTNFFCNLIFALAILWMPKKQAFALQY